MKYKFSTKETQLEEVNPKKATIELIKSKLNAIEFVILVHEIKKELKEELRIDKKK